jgi:hypothetical protein
MQQLDQPAAISTRRKDPPLFASAAARRQKLLEWPPRKKSFRSGLAAQFAPQRSQAPAKRNQAEKLLSLHRALPAVPIVSKGGWSWGCVSVIASGGRTIWIADAHRDGKRFIVRADEKLTAFVELKPRFQLRCSRAAFPSDAILAKGAQISPSRALAAEVSDAFRQCTKGAAIRTCVWKRSTYECS